MTSNPLADALERLIDAQTGVNMGDLGGALAAARAALDAGAPRQRYVCDNDQCGLTKMSACGLAIYGTCTACGTGLLRRVRQRGAATRLAEAMREIEEWGCCCSPGKTLCPACIAGSALRAAGIP